MIVLLEDLDKVNERYQSIAHQLSSLNASSIAWAQLNRLNASIQDIAVSLSLSQTLTDSLLGLLDFTVCLTLTFSYVVL